MKVIKLLWTRMPDATTKGISGDKDKRTIWTIEKDGTDSADIKKVKIIQFMFQMTFFLQSNFISSAHLRWFDSTKFFNYCQSFPQMFVLIRSYLDAREECWSRRRRAKIFLKKADVIQTHLKVIDCRITLWFTKFSS